MYFGDSMSAQFGQHRYNYAGSKEYLCSFFHWVLVHGAQRVSQGN